MLLIMLLFALQKMCAIEEELETKLGVFKFTLNGTMYDLYNLTHQIYHFKNL